MAYSNRFTEGYGPNELAFRNAHDEGITLIITVDNGIQGHNEIKMVQDLGVDVIVTDHHEMVVHYQKHMQSYIQCIHRLIIRFNNCVVQVLRTN